MSSILRKILSSGVTLELAGPGRIKATGTLTDRVRALILANKPELLAELTDATHYRWRVSFAGGSREVCFLPEVKRAAVEEAYPGAAVAPLLSEVITELEAS